MAKKKKKDDSTEISMDSFLDILTCLVGVLVLIIILTSIDAAQTKVLIATPMEVSSDKKLRFVECRDEKLYRVDLDMIASEVDQAFRKLDETLTGDPKEMSEALKNLSFESENYVVDTAYILVGQYALTPKEGTKGDDLKGVNLQEMGGIHVPGWYGELLDKAEKDNDIITFLVRDNSFNVFKKARALAFVRKVQVAYWLLAVDDPIIFGLGGEVAMGQ